MSTRDGVTIQPIPPALEFPYPDAPHASSSAEDQSHGERLHKVATSHGPRSPDAARDVATPELLKRASVPSARPAPGPRRHHTELSAPTSRRPSLPGARRRRTGTPLQIYDPTILASDTDSDSDATSPDRSPGTRSTAKAAPARGRSSSKGAKGRRRSDSEYSRFAVGNEDYQTHGHVSKRDGRLRISLKETKDRGYLARAIGTTLRLQGKHGPRLQQERPESPEGRASAAVDESRKHSPPELQIPPPCLNIVIMVIGSRGDIQPFLRLGKVLHDQYHHRVRIATHPAFKAFVESEGGLEFFSVGGDPAELMAFMVKNPGLIPKMETIRAGEIGRRRAAMYEMFKGFWRACINTTDDETDVANLKMLRASQPFVANAIIANPPSYAHVHCAERLGVPLHLMFTFPTSPTQSFPHPLTQIRQSNTDASYTNFMSYPLVDLLTWQGLGDLVNDFRVKSLGLEPMATLWAPGQLCRLKVPHTYLWSEQVIPKPPDWGPEINVTGFVFLDLASTFEPPNDLKAFLDRGEPPVYIGFGSIVVDDPDRFTELILEAVRKAGVRALVSKGWGDLGGEQNIPENVFMLGNTPHDWLFPRVRAVIHHGGAGTTAIGLRCGKPTMIVPFFGDQPFWGAMVAKAGAGAEPIPYKKLSVDKLAAGITHLLRPEAQQAAQKISEVIADEGEGAGNAIKSFHASLNLAGNHSMRCSIFPDRTAVWWLGSTHFRLSALAAEMLVARKRLRWQELTLIRHCEWNDFEGPGEPVTGVGAALVRSAHEAARGVGHLPYRWMRTVRGTRRRKEHRAAHARQQAHHEAKLDGSPPSTLAPPSPADPPPRSTAAVARDLAHDARAGAAQTGRALASAPVDLALALAQGFHNAPRLYGDATVRAPPRVDGVRSGLGAAGTEAARGIADGWTGLARHPRREAHAARADARGAGPARKAARYAEGAGLGFGKGLGGLVLKDLAAVAALPAYTLLGVQRALLRPAHRATKQVRRAQVLQGARDAAALGKDERRALAATLDDAWSVITALREETRVARSKGRVQGRLVMWKGKKAFRRAGAFESTAAAGRALEAARKGEDLEAAVAER